MEKKKTIICIVGASGSGKTVASLHLKNKLGIDTIVSYTTRPMRKFETDGLEHNFVSEDAMPPFEEMLAYTFFGGYHYWTSIDQLKNEYTVYVIDEKGLDFLQERFSDRFDIVSIFVDKQFDNVIVDDERKERDVGRELENREYDYVIVNKNKKVFLDEICNVVKNIIK